jgi:ubiquinone/menaquinone biosynthesis C-methylase UbiE
MEKFEDKKISIDIAGGEGDYLYAKARQNPGDIFIVLDPTDKSSGLKLDNLHRIKWKSDIDSRLPFQPHTIDEASINFLMGELRTKEKGPETVGMDMAKYARLLKDVKEVLKLGGKVRIVEPKPNIKYVEQILEELGFNIVSGPIPLPYSEKYMSKYSKMFFDVEEMSGNRLDDEDSIHPMAIEATR